MPFAAILREVDQLNSVSKRLEGLAEPHAPISESTPDDCGKGPQYSNRIGCAGCGKRPEADLSTAGSRPRVNRWRSEGGYASFIENAEGWGHWYSA